MDKKTEAHWQSHIDAYLSSGLSIKKYCKFAGVLVHQFKYRYDRYRIKQTVSSPATQSKKTPFTPVSLVSPSTTQAPFKILLRNGHTCMVPTPFDPKALQALLAILSS